MFKNEKISKYKIKCLSQRLTGIANYYNIYKMPLSHLWWAG